MRDVVNGYGFFKIYFKLKLHFTSNYDIFKNKRSNTDLNHFMSRKDITRFEFIAKQLSYGKDDMGRYCLANFVYNENGWLYQSFEQSREVYEKWKGIRAAMVKGFELDLNLIESLCHTNNIPFHDIMKKTKTGKQPPLLQLIAAKLISYETSVILANEYEDFTVTWEKLCDTDPLMDDIIFKIRKYKPFVIYNADTKTKFRDILSEKVH